MWKVLQYSGGAKLLWIQQPEMQGGFWIGEVEEKQADPTVQKVGVLVLGSIIEFSIRCYVHTFNYIVFFHPLNPMSLYNSYYNTAFQIHSTQLLV